MGRTTGAADGPGFAAADAGRPGCGGAAVEPDPQPRNQSMGELFKQLFKRPLNAGAQELRLAQAEMTEKGKRAGFGAGPMGGGSSSSNSCVLGCHVYCSPLVMGVVTTTTGGTTVLEKVFYTSVLVSDQDKALDFYTKVLGLEKRVENPTPDGPRFLTVGVKGDEFQLVLWPGTPGQAEPAMGRPPASITIESDDCRKTVEELKARGVEFVSDVLEFPWGYVAQFQDPDGNRLQIREGR